MTKLKKVDQNIEDINHNFEVVITAFDKQTEANEHFLALFHQVKAVLTDIDKRLKAVEEYLNESEIVHIHNTSKEIH